MTLTREVVASQILAYLNHEIPLAELVNWAENTFIDDVIESESDIDLLDDIVMYLAAADTPQFPLTWEICCEFMHRLGQSLKVVAEAV